MTLAVALCGHEYQRPQGPGRRRKYGDCDCAPAPTASTERTCARCGQTFFARGERNYCSDRCRVAIARRAKAGVSLRDREAACEICGCAMVGKRSDARRCSDCRARTFAPLPERKCPTCGEAFAPQKRAQVNCSNKCAQRAYKAANRKPEPWDERRKANYQKRRALKLKLPADSIRPLDVFERDAWICGLCGDPVPEGVAWPDPLSASLDHVIPLSKGGHHVLENVQLAHLSCNVQKGARTP